MCSIDYEPADAYSRTWPVARKAHWCCECGEAIPKGERYERAFMAWDGTADTFKTHKACRDLASFIQDVFCEDGDILHGGLDEECGEAWRSYGEYYQDGDAWEAAGLPAPNPLEEVFDEIKAHYARLAKHEKEGG